MPTRPLIDVAAEVLLECLEEGVIIVSADGGSVISNPAAERILGLAPGQMDGSAVVDPDWLVLRPDGSRWSGRDLPLARALRDSSCTDGMILQLRDGTSNHRTLSISIRPVVRGRTIVAVVATIRDVTHERLAADRASDNERQLLDALHDTGLAVATSDRNGHLLTANQSFAEMVGRAEDELLGMHFTEFSGPDAFDDQLAAVERLREGKDDQFQIFKSYVRPDGILRHALMHLLVLRNHNGEIERHVSLVQDVTEQLLSERALTIEARTDPLTGLLNRRGVLSALDVAVSGGPDRPFLVAFVDLDGFKAVNDRFGHEAGDRILDRVARAMEKTVRSTDVLGRLGGDEFVVIFMDAPSSAADRLCESLQRAVESLFDDEPALVGASVGMVAPVPGETAPEILHRADSAMYARKRAKQHAGDRSTA